MLSTMRSSCAHIDEQLHELDAVIAAAHEEVSSVLEYFGEDPKRNPTDFFTTLASFCSVLYPIC